MTKRRVLFPQQMYDISLVDADKAVQRDEDAIVEIVKAKPLSVVPASVPVEKAAKYSTPQLQEMASDGRAMYDGSYAIADEDDLDNAIQAADTTNDHQRAFPHILKRAFALGKTDKLPDHWRVAAQKAEFSDEERKQLAKSGAALPDGSFPIRNKQDLHNAMQAIGRAKDPAKAKAHIKSRAKSLGLTDELTEAFKAADLPTEPEPVEEIPDTDPVEANKAGAAISAKNRSLLQVIKDALSKLLPEEAAEPEHQDIAAQLENDARQLADASKAETLTPEPTTVEEDEDVAIDYAELAKAVALAVTEANKPVLAAIEAQKAIPVELTPLVVAPEAPATAIAAAVPADVMHYDEAVKLYEARKAQGIAQGEPATRTAIALTTPEGRKHFAEVAKAVPLAQRPTFIEGLRMLNGRNLQSGLFDQEAF